MAVTEEARAARDAKLDELHARLTGAVETLVSGEDWARALEFAARFRSRSFNNTLLIWVQHEAAFEAGKVPTPMPSHVAGYRQWQQLGRQVQKGQQGYMIFAPVTGLLLIDAGASMALTQSWPQIIGLYVGGILIAIARLPDDGLERRMDIRGEMRAVAADIEMGAILQPGIDVARLFHEPVLHIGLRRAVAREGHVHARQDAILEETLPFRLVEEIGQ